MESALCPLLSALILLLCSSPECKGQDTVTQPEPDVTASEGLSAQILCNFKTSSTSSTLFWYKQEGHNAPKYILKKYKASTGWGDTYRSPEFEKKRFDVETKEKSFVLKIQELDVSDSAVYYCALRPAQGGSYKLIFGRGTRLTVETTKDETPSVFKLEDQETKVCLATGFTRLNKMNATDPFKARNVLEGVRINKDSVYNSVAVMSEGDTCPETGRESCDEKMQADLKVNMMSLTILGLRVLFVKTVAFNVLMTLKLWLRR